MTAAARTPIAGHEHVFEPGASGWTLLLLHGTGGDEHDLVPLGRQLLDEAALLSPRGRVLEGGITNRFFARRAANDIDIDDLRVRTDELAAFVRESVDTYELDPARIVALGYSNGANIALAAMLQHPGLLRGAALLRPVLYDRPDELPDLAGTSVLASAGALDPYTPPEVVEQLRSVLEDAGARLELHVQPGVGHGLAPVDLQLAATWVRTLAGA